MSIKAMPETHRAFRPLFIGLGVVCVGLGYLGAVLPVMPSTIFFLIALWAFKRSSPQFEDWLMNKSFIGPTLRDWEEHRSIKRSTKVTVLIVAWTSILVSALIVDNMVARGVLVACGLLVTVIMAKTNTKD